jgi:hypothetical protein
MLRSIALISTLALVGAACTDDGSAASTTGPTSAETSDAPLTASNPDTVGFGVSDSSELPGDLPAVTGDWDTDWTRTTIELDELIVGILIPDPRDGIPPIDNPQFESVTAGAEWLSNRDPGVLIRHEDGARFYPLGILNRHEIVNDQLGGVPISVTYCPLCNTGVAFDRRIDGVTHRFGVSGLLRKSDLVMWDDLTGSLWQQITGEGIVGTHAGVQLTIVPSSIVSYGEFAESFPDGQTLSRDTGFNRQYGLNFYEYYSSRTRVAGIPEDELDDRFPALERVVGVSIAGAEKAYPFSVISEAGAINDEVAGSEIVVFWGGNTADALDGPFIAQARSIGTGVAYSSVVDGTPLTFTPSGDSVFTDDQTGSNWSILGNAIDGPLAGKVLDPVIHRNEFWFAWAAFFPEGDVYGS